MKEYTQEEKDNCLEDIQEMRVIIAYIVKTYFHTDDVEHKIKLLADLKKYAFLLIDLENLGIKMGIYPETIYKELPTWEL